MLHNAESLGSRNNIVSHWGSAIVMRVSPIRPVWPALLGLTVCAIFACGGSTSTSSNVPSVSVTANPLGSTYTTDKPLIVGVQSTSLQMAFLDPNDPTKLKGFDIDMEATIMKHYGVPYQLKILTFAGMIPALQGHQIDAIQSAMFVTPDRLKVINFVTYLEGGTVAIVPKGNPKKLHSLGDMCGLRIIGIVGGVELTYLLAQSKTCTDAGKSAIDILTFPDNVAEFTALSQGRADGALVDASHSILQLQQYPQFEAAFSLMPRPIGIGLRKEDGALQQFFLRAVTWYRNDSGLYLKSLATYSLRSDLAIQPQLLTQ